MQLLAEQNLSFINAIGRFDENPYVLLYLESSSLVPCFFFNPCLNRKKITEEGKKKKKKRKEKSIFTNLSNIQKQKQKKKNYPGSPSYLEYLGLLYTGLRRKRSFRKHIKKKKEGYTRKDCCLNCGEKEKKNPSQHRVCRYISLWLTETGYISL